MTYELLQCNKLIYENKSTSLEQLVNRSLSHNINYKNNTSKKSQHSLSIDEYCSTLKSHENSIDKSYKHINPEKITYNSHNPLENGLSYIIDAFYNEFSDNPYFVQTKKILKPRHVVPLVDKPSFLNVLEQAFADVDSSAITAMLSQLNSDIVNFCKVTDKTYTGVVFSFDQDGKTVFCKVSSNQDMLRKEHECHQDASAIPLLVPIIPKPFAYFEKDGISALMTFGTDNDIITDVSSQQFYIHRRQVFDTLGKVMSVDLPLIERDPFMVDTYNLALFHTLMKDNTHKSIYQSAEIESVASIDKLDDWLLSSKLKKKQIREIKSMFEKYRDLAPEVVEFDFDATILAHYDARKENVFPDPLGFRPLGDFGLVKPGTEEFDVGKIEALNISYYAKAYTVMRKAIERMHDGTFSLADDFVQRTQKVAFLNSMRMLCFKASRGFDTSRYLSLATHYSNQV